MMRLSIVILVTSISGVLSQVALGIPEVSVDLSGFGGTPISINEMNGSQGDGTRDISSSGLLPAGSYTLDAQVRSDQGAYRGDFTFGFNLSNPETPTPYS